MKKAFCFSLIVMFLALACSPLLVKADDVVVNDYTEDSTSLTQEQIKDLTNSTLLLEYLRKGGTIDVKNTSDDYSFDDLIDDFGNFVDNVVDTAIDFVNPFQTEVQYHGLQPIRLATPAIWNLLGILPFYALNNSDNQLPDHPSEFDSLIDLINGDSGVGKNDFYWRDYENLYMIEAADRYYKYPLYLLSYHFTNGSGTSAANRIFEACELSSAYIVTQENGYQVNIDTTTFLEFLNQNASSANVNSQYYCTQISGILSYNGFTGYYSANTNHSVSYHGTYNDLNSCFTYLASNWRNINIYVDGVPWSVVGAQQSYNIEISTGTNVPIKDGTGKIEWLYDYEIYFDIDRLQDDVNSILHLIKNTPNTPTIIKWDDLQDVIVDVDGQPAIGVKILTPDTNIDLDYLATYGPIIPAFLPMFTPVINDTDIYNIASTAVSPIPDDLLEVFGYMFMGVLFIGFIHRLLE